MDETTIRSLNQINRRFYETVADDFDATRQKPWQGWNPLLLQVELRLKAPVRVLDVGCGNGRFGVFLAEHLGKDGLRYHGIDSSAALLERAKRSLDGIDAQFEQRDIVENPPDSSLGQFDLVALFGVLHHIPDASRRLALLRALGERVVPGGLLVFTEWRFYELERFRERIVPWEKELQVERGDYLLDWRNGERALRYCHYVDDAEHAWLVAATGLKPIAEYRADMANLYTICCAIRQM